MPMMSRRCGRCPNVALIWSRSFRQRLWIRASDSDSRPLCSILKSRPPVSMLSDMPLKTGVVREGLSNTFMLFESAGKPNHYKRGVLQIDDPVPPEKYRWASGTAYDTFGITAQLDCPITTLMNCD